MTDPVACDIQAYGFAYDEAITDGKSEDEARATALKAKQAIHHLNPVLTEELRGVFFASLIESLRRSGWSDDYIARQLVDDAVRSGIDLRFYQHIVEAKLNRIHLGV
jgi:hypothetical protein